MFNTENLRFLSSQGISFEISKPFSLLATGGITFSTCRDLTHRLNNLWCVTLILSNACACWQSGAMEN